MRKATAKALLRSGHTVSRAAARSGFGSAESLPRVFATRVGVSPSAYAASGALGDGRANLVRHELLLYPEGAMLRRRSGFAISQVYQRSITSLPRPQGTRAQVNSRRYQPRSRNVFGTPDRS